ncbi:SDR family NAD(P)-dependent oxidoreductase [Pedobacter lusitanus]|uniref:SDR family NAD(P)-dependent oxidoreductase n=1 Tax=Pedobacter lusitanus TaxID=1503925 RepID=UPI002934EBC6|nr:SDR family oxidoreductase [Pedobacter lusitanus]
MKKTLDTALEQLGNDFIGITGDVTNLDDLEKIFKGTFEKFGKIDVLVANAGGAIEGIDLGSVTDFGEESYDKYMNLNVKSAYLSVQKALPYMNDGGSIVLIASVAAHIATPGMSVYGAAKAAVISFAKGFSLDLLSRQIRVNVLTLGSIDTPVFAKMVPEEHIDYAKQLWANFTPVGRIGQPSDVANAAVFLASDASSFILGTEITVDGGFSVMNLMK